MNIVLAFSGKIGSGKSSISSDIAEILNWDKISFGNYVRQLANENSIEINRENLQNLGESLVKTDPSSFCYSVLNQMSDWIDNSFIVEGIRHEIILDILISIVKPSHLYHIHLITSEGERKERVISRSGVNEYSLKADFHSSEIDVNQKLFCRADFIVNTSELDIRSASISILNWLKSNNTNFDIH